MFKKIQAIRSDCAGDTTVKQVIFATLLSTLSLNSGADAGQDIVISHRIGNFTPAAPNSMTLELRLSNTGTMDLQHIRLESTSPEIAPDTQTNVQIGTLQAGDQTTAYWTLATPITYHYVVNGSPLFFRLTAHSATNEHVTLSVTSMLRGN